MSLRTVRTVRAALTGAVAVAALAAAALVNPAAADSGTGETGGTHRSTQRAIEAAVRDGVPGVVAQARDRDGTWSGTAGVANLRTGRERLPQDRFRVGSITKTFVATVVLQLEAEGRLSLDDTVEQWLPGVVRGNGHDGRRITLRQLLNHTSGIYNYTDDPGFLEKVFGDGFFQHRYDTWTPAAAGGARDGPPPRVRPRHGLEVLQHQLHPRRNGRRTGDGTSVRIRDRAPDPAPAPAARHLRARDRGPDAAPQRPGLLEAVRGPEGEDPRRDRTEPVGRLVGGRDGLRLRRSATFLPGAAEGRVAAAAATAGDDHAPSRRTRRSRTTATVSA